MTTEPTTHSGREPWRCLDCRQAPTGVCTWHAAYDAGVWAARAALLDEMEAAVRDITERHARLHTCSTKKVHADLRSVLALIQQHREEGT